MASSMIQRRQEAERARVEAYDCSLRRVSQTERAPPNFERAIDEAKRGFETYVVRDARTWKPKFKTRDAAKLRLAAARYLFARFPVAEHLEAIWTDTAQVVPNEVALRKRWFVIAASGGSLRAEATGWLSRAEVHAFLNPIGRVDFDGAIWQAIARSYTNDTSLLLRLGQTRVARGPRQEHAFWRDATRFFCANPAPNEQIDDLCDYLADRYRRDASFSLKGRTLATLARDMHEWHHDLDAVARIEAGRRRAEEAMARARGERWVQPAEGGRWAGAPIAMWSWRAESKKKRTEYMVVQLCTADDLVAETRAMRHCVSTYASKCIAGNASIWSLRVRDGGTTERLLTIELDRQHRAVQVRGFANRLAHADEVEVLKRWAKARGIILT